MLRLFYVKCKSKAVFKRLFKKKSIDLEPSEKVLYLDLKRILGESPQKFELYKTAFVHRSASQLLALGHSVNNERLEYLGDAILNAIVAEYLYLNYPSCKEGQLSQMRSKVVSHSTLAQIARNLGIEKYIVSQPNLQQSGKYFQSDMLEALIGAFFVDKGFEKTRKMLFDKLFIAELSIDNIIHQEVDFKSRIIERCQKNKQSINFVCRSASANPSKSTVLFTVDLMIDGKLAGTATGVSKKEAEQAAAHYVLDNNANESCL